MQITLKYILSLLLLTSVVSASDISFLPYKKNEFSPVLKEQIAINYALVKKGSVQAEIYTPDGLLIRTLSSDGVVQKGEHSLQWDGKDEKGIVVPDEAYNVVLKAKIGTKQEVVDPRTTSGGIVQRNLHPKVNDQGKITYTLPTPSRVLIRLGIEHGAMLRSVINWIPKNSGKNMQFWDEYDQDHLIKILGRKDFKIIFSAFSLADFTILTTGNNLSYFQYAHMQKSDLSAKKLRLYSAKSNLMSPYYVRSLSDLKEPAIHFVFPDTLKKDPNGIPIVKKGDRIRVKVVMGKEDAQRMAKVKYEITFFDDLDFVSEEEMGYVPISWLWSPQKKKGKHILTVNIASFKGHIGLRSTPYIME